MKEYLTANLMIVITYQEKMKFNKIFFFFFPPALLQQRLIKVCVDWIPSQISFIVPHAWKKQSMALTHAGVT